MIQHQEIRTLISTFKAEKFNEADTRSNVIDPIIHDVLDWPKSAVKRELAINPGFADYVLFDAAGIPALVIEAKREGNYFEIPTANHATKLENNFKSIRTLLTDKSIREAINQARNYCLEIGCNFGCISNGQQWIFFKVFEPGFDWKTLRAYLIPSLEAMEANFTKIYNSFSHNCVCFDGSLNELLSSNILENKEIYRPADDIPAYTRTIQANAYVQYLRPIGDRFFGNMETEHPEFMNACYVSDSSYEDAFASAAALLTDSLTPYLEEYRVQNTKNDIGGGQFGNRIEKSVTIHRGTDVVVLFGGKGIGKSTFLRRLLFLKPPQVLKKNAVTVFIDLLNIPEDKNQVDLYIWKQLVNQLDTDNLLIGTRDGLLKLFGDRYAMAEKQDLFGIPSTDITYNRRLNDLIAKWKEDYQYVAQQLMHYLQSKHKGAVVVIDNTDQYKALQEHCFTTARHIATNLRCLVIVSMREERFYASSIHGVLDAFQNSGFHLSSPSPHSVFLKRLDFVQSLLRDQDRFHELLGIDAPEALRKTILKLLANFDREFREKGSHLSNFLVACSHGNIRLALQLFRGMLQSRYTNIDEITSRKDWTWQIHQVLKPVMIPNRFFYEEKESYIPNVFQLRSKKRSSHFTVMRILSTLTKLSALQGAAAFLPLAQLFTSMANRFHMEEDQKTALDVLLRYGLIETSNRIDEYAENIDSVRATSYGIYIYEELCTAFTYIDLVSTDTSLFNARVSAELASLSGEEYALWQESTSDRIKRFERVEKRIAKALEFVNYLAAEEEREAQVYSLHPDERFMQRIKFKLEDEIEGVRKSAGRQKTRR